MEKRKWFKILVVDADPQFLDITVRSLKNADYEIYSASNGTDCLAILSRNKPDIMLLDIMLPDINSSDICKKIKSDPEFSSVFVILLSSLKNSINDAPEGMNCGADDYVMKPVESLELLSRVGTACRIIAAEKEIIGATASSSYILFESSNEKITGSNTGVINLTNKDSDELIGYHKSTSNHIDLKISKLENNFKALIEKATDGIVLLSADGIFKYISPTARKLFGYEASEEIASKPADLTHPDDLPMVLMELVRLQKDPLYIPTLQYRFASKNGNWIWIESTCSNLLSDPAVESIVLNFRNINDRKLAENALLESERLLMESQKVAHLGSFVWNISGDLWKSSKILDEIFGIDENYTRSFDGWTNLIHPDWKAIMSDYVTIEVLEKHKKFDKEYQIIRQSDKKTLWVHGLSELEFDANNKPSLLIGTIIDITERKMAEIELHRSHEELEKSKLATLKLLEEVIKENEARKKSEEKYRLAKNEISKLNIELENRVIQRTAQLDAANKELEAFAYTVSHDLRAPLRAIDGFSKFLIEDYSVNLDEEGKRLIGLIRKNTQRMDQLIINILALSRVSRGDHRESDIDMTKMVMSMYNECVTSDTTKKMNFKCDPLPNAFGDSIYIKQVWTNLISNAVKFSSLKSNPLIKVGGSVKDGFNVYYIKDNGAGFKQEYAHKLFGVFQRLHKADEFEGTGVGLAIVQRIIHRHGGEVWAESKEGEGATFYFSIPVKK